MKLPKLNAHFSKLNNILYVSYVPKVINTAIEIQLFELLSKYNNSLISSPHKKTLDNIVTELGIQKSITEALLNVLNVLELVSIKNGVYSLTVLAEEFMVRTSEACQIHAIKEFDGSNGPFNFLLQSLKGETPQFNGKMWSSKEASLNMEQGQKAGGLQSVVAFVKSIPQFTTCTKMCDLAGNIGYFSYAFLQENTNLKSHVYDLPEVCKNAIELKQNEASLNRISYHGFDINNSDDFGEGYDFFFISHYLYEYGANGTLVDFLQKVNKSMKPGGLLVSNHICDMTKDKETDLTLALVELRTRIMGYPTHQLSAGILIPALIEAGFSTLKIQQPDGHSSFSTMLISAIKI